MAKTSHMNEVEKTLQSVEKVADMCDHTKYDCYDFHIGDVDVSGVAVKTQPGRFATMLVRHYGFQLDIAADGVVGLAWDDADEDYYYHE